MDTTFASAVSNDDSPPVISLQASDAVQRISTACSTWGAFVVVDHGVPRPMIDKVLSIGHSFFDLPLETKLKYNLQKYGAKWRGYMPLFGERSVGGTLKDHKEGLYFGDSHEPHDPRVLAGLPTFGTNVYPNDEIPEMQECYEMYHQEMAALGDRMMVLLSLGMGLPEDTLNTALTKGEPVLLPRAFRYPPQPAVGANDGDPRWGIGNHSDYGLWTMIVADAPGLEFQHPVRESWHAVPFVPGSIIMNVGDVLDRLTSGKYVSAYHRVFNYSDTISRLSLPFFYDPAWNARMKTVYPAVAADAVKYNTPERTARWSKTKISFDVEYRDGYGVEYSECLAKKVAKVFPDLVPEELWASLSSTKAPSTRHAVTVHVPDKVYTDRVIVELKTFYESNPQIKKSHGLAHALAVHEHAVKAIACLSPPLCATTAMEVRVASLLHDVDDYKYFPSTTEDSTTGAVCNKSKMFPNAQKICSKAGVPSDSVDRILTMIDWVSCTKNGNSIPQEVHSTGSYHLLIPRWCDRLEAVGAVGVVRCYQCHEEFGRPLWSGSSPTATTEEAVLQLATPERFEAYVAGGGKSDDMISHYYDKLLHIACPPSDKVRNSYLEKCAKGLVACMVDVCVRFGRDGVVDVAHIKELEKSLLNKN